MQNIFRLSIFPRLPMNDLGIIVIHSRRSVPNEYSAQGESMVQICTSCPSVDLPLPTQIFPTPRHHHQQQQPPGPDILLRETALIIVPRMITSQNISSISRGGGGSSREPPVSCRCRRQVSLPVSLTVAAAAARGRAGPFSAAPARGGSGDTWRGERDTVVMRGATTGGEGRA